MSIRTLLDQYLDRYTMHRVTLLALVGLVLWGVVLSLLGILRYSAIDIAGAAILATVVATGVNAAFARVLRAASDPQSNAITALILALIVPVGLGDHWAFLVGAAAVAAASKYVVTVDRQHLFNPAAVSVAALALLFPWLAATWWVGSAAMLPVVVACGVVVALKARRTGVVLTFVVAYLLITSIAEVLGNRSAAFLPDAWRLGAAHTALLFFAFIMMTDPITIPSGKHARPAYVAFVALLYATPEVRLLSFGLTPEQALCVGNAVSFAIRPKSRLTLLLMRKRRVGADTWWLEFGVGGPRRFEFRPGQFLEWTVPHPHPDGRGQRRSFTIASSPTERDIGIVMRVPERASSFKQALVAAQEGSRVTAARLSGDFVLPPDLTRPLAFVASGVGVAPFRSMARYIVDHDLRCDIVMLYMTRRADEILFSDTFERAERLGLRTVYLLTDQDSVPPGWSGRIGRVNAEVIVAEVPGFEDRTFFVCGSHRMVRDLGSVLRGLGVRRSRISADWFDGSADS